MGSWYFLQGKRDANDMKFPLTFFLVFTLGQKKCWSHHCFSFFWFWNWKGPDMWILTFFLMCCLQKLSNFIRFFVRFLSKMDMDPRVSSDKRCTPNRLKKKNMVDRFYFLSLQNLLPIQIFSFIFLILCPNFV